MIKKCGSCHDQTEHSVEEYKSKVMKNFFTVKCLACGFSELVPESKLGEMEEEIEVNEQSNTGFDRDIDPECAGGHCPVR